MKKIILLGVLLIVLVGLVTASDTYYCYQESANVSTGCGGVSGGKYANDDTGGTWTNMTNIYDADYNTFGYHEGAGTYEEGYLYVNYTKPGNAIGAIWQVKGANSSTVDLKNVSLPGVCYHNYADIIALRVITGQGPGLERSEWQCKNFTGAGTGWYNLTSNTLNDVYEEGIFWNMSEILGNCSTYENLSLSFLLFNETTGANISTTVDFSMQYNISDTSISYSTTEYTDNLSICLDDNTTVTSLTVSSLLLSYTISGRSFEYSYSDLTLTNQPQSISLYVSDGTSVVTFTVTDENDDPVSDALIGIELYDVGTDTYKTTETLNTDSDGEALGNLVLYTEWYRFRVTYDDTEYLLTERSKLDDTSVSLQINLGTTPVYTSKEISNLDIDIGTDDTNSEFNINWTNINGTLSKLIFNISKINLTDSVIVYGYENTSGTGQLIYNIPEPYNLSGYYVGNIYGVHATDGQTYFIKGATLDIREEWDVFGDESMLMAFFFVGTMACIGIAVSAVLGLLFSIMGLIVFYAMGFMQLTMAGLMSVIVCFIIVIVRIRRGYQ